MKRALRNLDLNLLLVFDVLWAERSVSATARRISRTQSAVSLALERLRKKAEEQRYGRIKRLPFDQWTEEQRAIMRNYKRVK